MITESHLPRPSREGSTPGLPPVTVLISTFNRRDQLEATLVAMREQTYPRFEVVVVNGPSTDGTAEMLQRFGNSGRWFTCSEASVSVSRNIGFEHAAGDIVALIDDDAIPRPDWLEQIVPAFADPRVAAVGGPVFDVPLDRVEWKLCTCSRIGVPNVDSTPPIGQYQGVGADPVAYFAGCNMALRRTVVQEIGGFNSAIPYTFEDTEICCRANDAGYHLAYVEDALVRHYRANSAMREEQKITDPYPLILGRIVFALHSAGATLAQDDVLRLVPDWTAEWEAHAAAQLATGAFSRDEHEHFVARAAVAAAEGIVRGTLPRPFTTIGPARVGEFLQYR